MYDAPVKKDALHKVLSRLLGTGIRASVRAERDRLRELRRAGRRPAYKARFDFSI